MEWTTHTPEQEAMWREWVAQRPESVRAVAERFSPWTLYRMKSTGQRVTVYSFGEGEDGSVTLTVNVTGEFNFLLNNRQVFGIDPDDLEECDLPSPNEPVGAVLSGLEIEENIDEIRLAVRPDLWEPAPDGTAVRKGRN